MPAQEKEPRTPGNALEISFEALAFRPLSVETWPDFIRLFEEHGIQNGCWCMYWRTAHTAYHHGFGEGNKQAFKAIVDSGKIPGILAYLNEQPVAWCSIAPREDFPVLERSRTLKRVDEQPVWSITCFFVSRPLRQHGLTEILIREAIRYAGQQGATIVEAYPLRTEITRLLPYERFMGIQSTFERIGFVEAASRSERRPIMRFTIQS
jgi:GNAT superfamily N-acetyltransferase